MAEIKAHQLDAALKSGLAAISVILVHGPDAGHVSEVAARIAKATGATLGDGIGCLRGDADDFLADGRLLDEAMAMAMFGGKRLIWLKLGQKSAVTAATLLLEQPTLEAQVLIEAGDLKSGHALRTLCDKARNALSVICYADESDSIQRIAAEMISASGKRIERGALTMLVDLLGGDRALSRSEIAKLLLYCSDKDEIEAEDIAAIIADAGKIEPNAAIDAAFCGDIAEVEPLARRVIEDGLDAGVLLGFAYRHIQTLIALIDQRRSGLDLKEAARRGGIHFRREALVGRQVSLWSEDRLIAASASISQAIAESRRSAILGPSLATRTLWTIALAARRSG